MFMLIKSNEAFFYAINITLFAKFKLPQKVENITEEMNIEQYYYSAMSWTCFWHEFKQIYLYGI